MKWWIGPVLLMALLMMGSGCGEGVGASGEEGPAGWMEGDVEQNVEQLARHYGGMSTSMVEIGYRYNELYFAGRERNWPLAAYHVDKLGSALEHGLERRPGRDGPPVRHFLNEALPGVQEAIEQRDGELFQERFIFLMQSCNQCHVAQEMGFLEVRVPEQRLYPWRTPAAE